MQVMPMVDKNIFLFSKKNMYFLKYIQVIPMKLFFMKKAMISENQAGSHLNSNG